MRFEEIGLAAYLTKPIKQRALYDCLAMIHTGAQQPPSQARRRIITQHTIGESPRRRSRVLLVQDNPVNQKVALAMLSKLGLRVDAVANGLEAIDALKTIAYDVVLMDCQMPELDGYEATRRIRAAESPVRNPCIPIIALTANAMQEDRDRCLEAGMDDYLPKPVDPQALSDILAKWLRGDNRLKDTPVVMLTGSEDPDTLQELMPLQVRDHTCKDSLEEVTEKLRKHLKAL